MDSKWPRDPDSRSEYGQALSTRRASQDGSAFGHGDKRNKRNRIKEEDHGPEVRPERLGVEQEAMSVCLGSLWPSDFCEEKGETGLANVARSAGKVEERGRDGISALGEEVGDDEGKYVCD